mgnify:CR=1 FL=1
MVRVVILLSLFSAANAILLIGSRLPYGLSRDGLIARGMSNVNPGGTPVPALLITTLATIALIVSGTFNQILALAAFFTWCSTRHHSFRSSCCGSGNPICRVPITPSAIPG